MECGKMMRPTIFLGNFMKNLMKLCLFLLVVLVIVAGVSPYYQLHRLKTAHERGDHATIVQAVDFERLRPNLKTQLYTKVKPITSQLPKELQSLGFNEENLNNFAHKMIDGAIDHLVTHEQAMRLVEGDASGLDEGAAVFALVGMADDNTANFAPDSTEAKEGSQYQLGYCGINCFFVKTQLQSKDIDVRLTRHGLWDWKIDNVILP